MFALGIVLGVLGALILGVWAFLKLHPVFGKPLEEVDVLYGHRPEFLHGRFRVVHSPSLHMPKGRKERMGLLKTHPDARPPHLPSEPIGDLTQDGGMGLYWLGHSSFILRLHGKTLLLDPVFGQYASPIPLKTLKRYHPTPIALEEIPDVDLALISHDHYDHLDYPTIKALKSKIKAYATPLGLAGHLQRWGVSGGAIYQLGWWEQKDFDGITVTALPAQHFSGRSLSDRGKSHWCGFGLETQGLKLFFSGDSGYGDHFREIGDRMGGFDMALMESGQYNKFWPHVHMFPHESVQACIDIKAKIILPIHWGAFTLSKHSWLEPVRQIVEYANAQDLAYTTPKLGQRVDLKALHDLPRDAWWEGVGFAR